MFGFTGIQELIVLMVVIGVISMTGLGPRIIKGMRELRGDAPLDKDLSSQAREECDRRRGL